MANGWSWWPPTDPELTSHSSQNSPKDPVRPVLPQVHRGGQRAADAGDDHERRPQASEGKCRQDDAVGCRACHGKGGMWHWGRLRTLSGIIHTVRSTL